MHEKNKNIFYYNRNCQYSVRYILYYKKFIGIGYSSDCCGNHITQYGYSNTDTNQ